MLFTNTLKSKPGKLNIGNRYHNHVLQEKSKLPLVLLKGKFHWQATYAETAESKINIVLFNVFGRRV